MSRSILLAASAGLLTLTSVMQGEPNDDAAAHPTVANSFDVHLLKAAGEYESWGRVDDELRWAPFLCRMPNPGHPSFSASTDEKTHGGKLYSLFAQNRKDYFVLATSRASDVGQVIVKQSWLPVETNDPEDRRIARLGAARGMGEIMRMRKDSADARKPTSDHFFPYVWKKDKLFKASKQADLFIMLKLDPKTPGTDAGWVYGTVTPDGKKVTSAGRVESCMKCHQDAKYDRLFGRQPGEAISVEIKRPVLPRPQAAPNP